MLFMKIDVVHFFKIFCVIQKEVHIARSVSVYFKELLFTKRSHLGQNKVIL
jgi:hypothetical protein